MKKMNTLCTLAVAVALTVSPLATTLAATPDQELILNSTALSKTSSGANPSGDESWATYYGMGAGAATFGLGYYRAYLISGTINAAYYGASGTLTATKFVAGAIVSKPVLVLVAAGAIVGFVAVGVNAYLGTSTDMPDQKNTKAPNQNNTKTFGEKIASAFSVTYNQTAPHLAYGLNLTVSSGQDYVVTPFYQYVLNPIGSASMPVINDIASHPVDFTVAAVETFGALSFFLAYVRYLNWNMLNFERNALADAAVTIQKHYTATPAQTMSTFLSSHVDYLIQNAGFKYVSTPLLNQALGFAFSAVFYQHLDNIHNFIYSSVESAMPRVEAYVQSIEPSTWFSRSLILVNKYIFAK